MEVVISEVIDQKQERFKIAWPDKETLMIERDRFLENKIGERKELLSRRIEKISEDDLAILTRLTLGAEFMYSKMKEISPIKLELPNKTSLIYNKVNEGITFSVGRMVSEDKTSEVILFMWCQSLLDLIKEKKNQKSFSVEELDIYVMSTAVQEFAHMLYIQGAEKGNKRKQYGLIENRGYQVLKMAGMEDESMYTDLNIEKSGRLWELDFLKHIFPESSVRAEVEEELKIGGPAMG